MQKKIREEANNPAARRTSISRAREIASFFPVVDCQQHSAHRKKGDPGPIRASSPILPCFHPGLVLLFAPPTQLPSPSQCLIFSQCADPQEDARRGNREQSLERASFSIWVCRIARPARAIQPATTPSPVGCTAAPWPLHLARSSTLTRASAASMLSPPS